MPAVWAVTAGVLVSTGLKVHAVIMGYPCSVPVFGLVWAVVVLALIAVILRLVKEFAEVGWGCRAGRPAPVPVTSGPRGGYAPRPRQYQSRGRSYQPRPQPRAYRPPVSQTDGYPDGWPDGPS